jgi:hypothetical protein
LILNLKFGDSDTAGRGLCQAQGAFRRFSAAHGKARLQAKKVKVSRFLTVRFSFVF